ncbi:MAG: hypothetical protein IJP71_00930 [Lachnospiraceae bacterium]|nr:hypothetical protein [Lachnospiraceae bacterium]
MNEQFNKTLSNFVKDFACRNEVIAKFNNRTPISEIVKELTFPISEDSVIAIIWDYLIESNIILLYEPGRDENSQYDIVRKDGELGKTYFEKVKKASINKSDYKTINIKELKADKSRYDKLDAFEKELLEKLPFKKDVYYCKLSFLTIA